MRCWSSSAPARHACQLAALCQGHDGIEVSESTGLNIVRLRSGPLGGNARLGTMITEDTLCALIFFIDPLPSLPHDIDVKSLLRLATLYNTPMAVNRASANAIIGSIKNGHNFT